MKKLAIDEDGYFPGFAHLKGEGAPIHPDDVDGDLTKKQYARQLKAYNDHYEIDYECPTCGRCSYKGGSHQSHKTICIKQQNLSSSVVRRPK